MLIEAKGDRFSRWALTLEGSGELISWDEAFEGELLWDLNAAVEPVEIKPEEPLEIRLFPDPLQSESHLVAQLSDGQLISCGWFAPDELYLAVYGQTLATSTGGDWRTANGLEGTVLIGPPSFFVALGARLRLPAAAPVGPRLRPSGLAKRR